MRPSSTQLPKVLGGSFTRSVAFDVWHGHQRVERGLRAESWSVPADLGGEVKAAGTAALIVQSVQGESVKPDGVKGLLSPFRASVEPIVTVSAGRFSEAVSLGRFDVSRAKAVEYTATLPRHGTVAVAARVELDFLSTDSIIRDAGFTSAESPKSSSCWAEIQRLSGLPVARSLPDVPVPAGMVWEAAPGARLAAVQALAGVLGGVAVVDSTGALTVVPDTPGAPVATLRTGDGGTVVSFEDDIDTTEIRNEVVGTFELASGRGQIHKVARLDGGPLSIFGLFGRRTAYMSGTVASEEEADRLTRAELERLSGPQVLDIPIRAHFNPLIEIGDVITLEAAGRAQPLTGQVVRVGLSNDALMDVTIRIRRDIA